MGKVTIFNIKTKEIKMINTHEYLPSGWDYISEYDGDKDLHKWGIL